MRKTSSLRIRLLVVAMAGWATVASVTVLAQGAGTVDFKSEFLKLCDAACEELNKEPRRPPRHKAFYVDSYAVRALAVAYDMTGKAAYLDACKAWSDRMLDLQSKMIPRGAYYMNYGRKPGQNRGGWYVADSSSIAMGVLATAVRCADKADKDRYLGSVESFAKLVMDNYVGKAGGITDGLWPKYGGEWWCSSGIFASLAFLLHDETGNEQYQRVALGAIDWLNRLDFTRVKHISFKAAAPAVIMYVFEAYAAGMPHLKAGTQRRKAALAQISKALQWMAENQTGRGKGKWNYNTQWGSKLGGFPFHMYVYARHAPEFRNARLAADKELRHISGLLFRGKKTRLSQLTAFAMMSYAEKLRPGALYRKTKPNGKRRSE